MQQQTLQAAGLDAGSAATRCVILGLEQGRLRFLGCGEAASGGWLKSRIADQKAVSESIFEAVREAESIARTAVESAVAGIGGATVRGANSRSVIELGRSREIEQRDVNRALERTSRVQLQEDRMVLQLYPQDFLVDDHPGHRDPRGMLASRLEANAHLITGSVQEHNSLVGAVNQAHLAVDESIYEALAACYAAVLPEDRREGIALVDIGAQSTELVVYYGDALQLASSLPVGGDHFTRDVAQVLCVSLEDAGLIKEQFGSAIAADTGANSLVELPGSSDREAREAPRRMVNEIIEARARELFQYVKRELARVGMEHALIGGVVLTGGGAQMSGMCDVAEAVLGCQARNGLAVGIQDWPEEIDTPVWTTAAGLAMYAARLKVQSEMEKKSIGLLARVLR